MCVCVNKLYLESTVNVFFCWHFKSHRFSLSLIILLYFSFHHIFIYIVLWLDYKSVHDKQENLNAQS